jgi:hypothetical protein
LGDNHPTTLTCLSDMAALYFKKGVYQKAAQYFETCLQSRQLKLGFHLLFIELNM